MLHLHSHPWGSRLTTLLLAVDCQFFVSMVNWHTWQDLYCLPTMCTCLIPSFTYMILMRHLAIVFLKMKTFLWIRWWSFNNSCEHVMHILHCISMHMKSCKGTTHLIIPSSFVSFQAMINNDTTCPWLMKLGSFYQGDYCDIVLHLCPEYYCNPADNCDHLWLQCINEGHVVYAPLYYVLFFPYGEPGWYSGLWMPTSMKWITLLQYMAYCIQACPNEFSTILWGCHLFQTYLVDMFVCINQECLHFIQTQQPWLHVTMLNGIEDALSMTDNVRATKAVSSGGARVGVG